MNEHKVKALRRGAKSINGGAKSAVELETNEQRVFDIQLEEVEQKIEGSTDHFSEEDSLNIAGRASDELQDGERNNVDRAGNCAGAAVTIHHFNFSHSPYSCPLKKKLFNSR